MYYLTNGKKGKPDNHLELWNLMIAVRAFEIAMNWVKVDTINDEWKWTFRHFARKAKELEM
jgi:hypothetical protein